MYTHLVGKLVEFKGWGGENKRDLTYYVQDVFSTIPANEPFIFLGYDVEGIFRIITSEGTLGMVYGIRTERLTAYIKPAREEP